MGQKRVKTKEQIDYGTSVQEFLLHGRVFMTGDVQIREMGKQTG